MSAAPDDVRRTVVELACRAPSVHNTQPWSWRTAPDGLDLLSDPARALGASDPTGRNLVISCGAALHHAQVVAEALGHHAAVARFPDADPDADDDPRGGTRLAHLSLTPAEVPDDAADTLLAVRQRCTDRRRFTSWPVPDDLLHGYARLAGLWGANAVPLVDVTDRFRVDRLADRARDLQARDRAVAREQAGWVDRGPVDGVPSEVLPADDPTTSVTTLSRFGTGLVDDGAGAELESSDGVLLLCGYADEAADWLRTGEALSAIWLRATLDGLSVVPLSQVVEVEETRSTLQHDVLGGLAVPHLLVRLGWQALSRSHLTRTGRRPLDDVLDAPAGP